MIYTRENKASLCRGDFHPAELYKGDKKIAGYVRTDVEGIDSVTLTDCYNDKVYDAQIIGNSVQDGDPTPEAPVDVQSVGDLVEEGEYAGKYKIPVTVRGKNLWKYGHHLVGDSSDKAVCRELMVSSNKWIKSGTTFTLSLTSFVPENSGRTNMRVTVEALLADGTSINAVRADYNIKGEEIKLSLTYTIPETEKEIKGLRMWLMDYSSNTNGVTDGYVKDIQIELGNTATEFEPYIEPQAIDIYLDEPLRKVGSSVRNSYISDYVDFDKKVTVRNAAEVIITSDMVESKSRAYANSYKWNAYVVRLPFILNSSLYYCAGFSNYLKKAGGNTSADLGDNYVFQLCNNNNNYLYIITTPASDETVEEIKVWVDEKYNKGRPLKFLLHRLDPVEELISLPELPTFKGTTIYEIDTSIAATISGRYKRMEV